MPIPSWLTVSTDSNKKIELEITIIDGSSSYPNISMTLSSYAELTVVNGAGPIYRPEYVDGFEVNSLLERRDKVASMMAGDGEITPEVIASGTDILIAATLNSLS